MKLKLIATIDKPEKPETEDKGLLLTTPSQINLYRTKMNMVAIKTYLRNGVLMTRTHTPKNMLALATEVTGKPYKYSNRTLRVVLAEALKDLEEVTDPYFKQAAIDQKLDLETYDERKKKGLCVGCGEKPSEGSIYCLECLNEQKNNQVKSLKQ